MLYSNQVKKTRLMILPAVFLILLFYAGPVLLAVFYSFTDKMLVGVKSKNWSFVGLENYIVMFKDKNFYLSLFNTIVFLVFSAIIGQQVLGFFLAQLCEDANRHVAHITGLVVLISWVTPEVVVSFIFFAFLNPNGSLNNFLQMLHLKPVAWLYDHAMLSVIFTNIWRGTAFSMLMFQAALKSVDSSVKEAAVIDGASGGQILSRITLPMISGSIMTNTILITLQTLGLFGLIYALTGGGPGFKTTTLPIYMYDKAFAAYQIGYGTAMAIVMLAFGMILSVIYVKKLGRDF